MYASVTDYASVYNDKYRQRRGGHTSFDRNIIPPLIEEFCRAKRIETVLDVSGGKGGLGESLKARGFRTFTTDFGALPDSSVIIFDLSQHQQKEIERVKRTMDYGTEAHLATCFDVLEHIDREHIADAVHNLYDLSTDFLIVSISTRPSIRDNLLHASLIPIPLWISIFETAGFRCERIDAFPGGTTHRQFPNTEDYKLINLWKQADIFSDFDKGEPRYLVFRKTNSVKIWADKKAEIDGKLDIAFRKLKREQFALPSDTRFIFNLHFAQEWSFFRPLFDVLPRQRVRLLIRRNVIDADLQRAIIGWVTRNGVEISEYDDVSDLNWRELRGSILISAAESAVDPIHIKSQQVIAAAKINGCRTFLLQHGIWPRSFEKSLVTFISDKVLTWGGEERRRINDSRQNMFETQLPWGVFPDEQDFQIGSPKFSDQLIGCAPPASLRFGADNSKYEKTVILATKNLRGRFGIDNIDKDFHDRTRYDIVEQRSWPGFA